VLQNFEEKPVSKQIVYNDNTTVEFNPKKIYKYINKVIPKF